MGVDYNELRRIISEASKKGYEASKDLEDGGIKNLHRICISGYKGIQQKTLNKAGINCYKHHEFSGTFVLNMSFGKADRNKQGLLVAIKHLENNNVECFMHYQGG